MKALALLLLLPALCYAEITVELYNVIGENSLDKAGAALVFSEAITIAHQELGIDLALVGYQEIALSVDMYDMDGQSARLGAARLHAAQSCKSQFCYYLFPPMQDATKHLWFGGITYLSCWGRSVAVGQAGYKNFYGMPRIRTSAVTLVHEMLHGWGCGHVDVEAGYQINLMDWAALRYCDGYNCTTVLPITLRTFNACYSHWQGVRTRETKKARRCVYLKKHGRKCRARRRG